MIVADDTVSKALAYLAEDPHPLALAQKDLTDAENARERMFAELFQKQSGSIRDKECAVEVVREYQVAKGAEAAAIFELTRHKSRTRAAEMIIEIWRTQNANARAAERVR